MMCVCSCVVRIVCVTPKSSRAASRLERRPHELRVRREPPVHLLAGQPPPQVVDKELAIVGERLLGAPAVVTREDADVRMQTLEERYEVSLQDFAQLLTCSVW